VLVEQGLGVGKKNIATNSTARDELIQGGGKPTVPCLKIERNGEDRWLYESGDIIAYLEQVAR
jgi:glutathione S-transferase